MDIYSRAVQVFKILKDTAEYPAFIKMWRNAEEDKSPKDCEIALLTFERDQSRRQYEELKAHHTRFYRFFVRSVVIAILFTSAFWVVVIFFILHAS